MSSNLQPPSAPAHDDVAAADIVVRRSEIDPGTEYIEPQAGMETRLAALMQDVLRIDRIGAADSFFELGGDSFQAVALFVGIEKEFGIALPPAAIIEYPSVAKLASLVAGQSPISKNLVTLAADGAEPALFFMHPFSHAILGYRTLAKHFGHTRKIYGLTGLADEQNHDPALSVAKLAETCAAAITSVEKDGPYFLVGHCLGGAVAYEVARHLLAQEHRIGLLVMIDTGIADVATPGPRRLARKLSYHLAEMREQAPSQWSAYIWSKIRKEADRRRRQSAPVDISGPPERLLDEAYLSFKPGKAECDVKIIRCTRRRYGSRDLGWSAYVAGRIEVCDLPIDHTDVLTDPSAQLIAEQIKRWLGQSGAA